MKKSFAAIITAAALVFAGTACMGPVRPGVAVQPGTRGEQEPVALELPVIGGQNEIMNEWGIMELPGVAAPVSLSDLIVPASAGTDIALDLRIPSALRITRPDSGSLTTTYESYFITGTSNPDRPVYFNGNEISRLGSLGTFGVLVNLRMGANTFTFSQGGSEHTVTITRRAATASTISQITQSSMFPAVHGGVQSGGTIPARCVAPSGAQVTASFGSNSVRLTQAAPASPGVAAVFTGSLPVGGGYQSGTNKIGPVTYTLNYNGSTSTYRSSGDIYVAGSGRVAVQVTSYAGFVYPDLSQMHIFKEKVKAGAREYITGQNNEYFKLASGGWIPMGMVSILEGEPRIANTVNGAASSFTVRSESYTLSGNRAPFYYSRVSDGIFYLTLYNTSGSAKPDIGRSKLFSNVSVANQENGSIRYAFKLRDGVSIWGYTVSFDGGKLELKFNYKPQVTGGSAQPLSGVRIMLDPGHGGTDPGALGVAGLTGPDEKTVNLAHSYAIRDALRSLGATVAMTRRDDRFISLDDRLAAIESWNADMFLSVHHNSMAESGDANRANGLEMYYHTSQSQRLANAMMSAVESGTGRNNRFVRQSYYRVTLLPAAPSILMELGFMSNPLEYERACTQSQIRRAADSVAAGVVATLR
ncbi:MAG: N-acetylmuramoyl-L-alanine amidase [Oscillospiraceae bacterium]|nr:N-acetylmuramoyl-L-alanine amidase [Oscillospiraceae bacterium]